MITLMLLLPTVTMLVLQATLDRVMVKTEVSTYNKNYKIDDFLM